MPNVHIPRKAEPMPQSSTVWTGLAWLFGMPACVTLFYFLAKAYPVPFVMLGITALLWACALAIKDWFERRSPPSPR